MRRTNLILVVTVTLTLLIYAYSQRPRSGSQSAQTNSESQPTKELIAKAKGKKLLVKRLPSDVEGLELKEGTLRLKPGYEFVSQPSGTFAVARMNGNGATSTTVDCSCPLGDYTTCSVTHSGNLVYCSPDKGCTKCIMTTSFSGARTAVIAY